MDETLTATSLDNYEAFIRLTVQSLQQSGELGEDQEVDAMVARMMQGVTAESAVQLFVKDANFVAITQGVELIPGEPLAYESEGALPWGNARVVMNGAFVLTDVDETAGTARVKWTQSIDPESYLEALPKVVESLIGGIDEPAAKAQMQAELAGAKFVNDQTCDGLIDIASGLAVKIDCVVTTGIQTAQERRFRETRLSATQRLVQP